MPSRGPFSISDYFINHAAWATSGAISVLAWIRPMATITTTSHLWGMFNSTGTNQWLRLLIDTNGCPRAQWRDGTTALTTHGTPTEAGAWSLIGMTFEPGVQYGLRVWHGGDYVGYMIGIPSYPSNIDSTLIGMKKEFKIADQPLDALLGPLACWQGSTPLTQAEIQAAAEGKDLRRIRPSELTNFYLMSGDAGLADLVGSFDYTETGAVPLDEDTPPIDYPQPCFVETVSAGRLKRLSFTWGTDPLGRCVFKLPTDLDGTLHRFEAFHDDAGVAGSTYNVKLLDDYGADVLIDRGEGLSFKAIESEIITIADPAAAGVHQAVPVMGGHTLQIAAGEATGGIFELYVIPRITRTAGIY